MHGYRPDLGYRVYVDKALEIAAPTRPAMPPGHAARRPAGKPLRLIVRKITHYGVA